MFNDTLTIIDSLKATTKRNEKMAILKANENNLILKEAFYYALHPYMNFYIRKIPKYSTPANPDLSLVEFMSHLSIFAERKLTGNIAITHMSKLLSRLTANDARVAELILKRDMKCGVSGKTINKIWKDLIDDYEVLLGESLDDKVIKNINYPAMAQTKLDGARVNLFVYRNSDGSKKVILRTRSGRELFVHNVFDKDAIDLNSKASESRMYDGEIVVLDKDGKILPRKRGNGIVNKAVWGTISVEEASRLRIVFWDSVSVAEFEDEISWVPGIKRYEYLAKQISAFPNSKLGIVENKIVNSFDEALEYYEESISKGLEGIMLKNTNLFWEPLRSPQIIKFKVEKECELKIVGWNPGTEDTKNEGKVGSLICESSDRKVQVSISGFSDDLRDEITRDIGDWLLSIVTVRYNEKILPEDSDTYSLYLPRFVERRYDKNTADSFDKIK